VRQPLTAELDKADVQSSKCRWTKRSHLRRTEETGEESALLGGSRAKPYVVYDLCVQSSTEHGSILGASAGSRLSRMYGLALVQPTHRDAGYAMNIEGCSHKLSSTRLCLGE